MFRLKPEDEEISLVKKSSPGREHTVWAKGEDKKGLGISEELDSNMEEQCGLNRKSDIEGETILSLKREIETSPRRASCRASQYACSQMLCTAQNLLVTTFLGLYGCCQLRGRDVFLSFVCPGGQDVMDKL